MNKPDNSGIDCHENFSQFNHSVEREKEFWQQWQKHRSYLYCCCLKWMRGNVMDAEDLLSKSMLKAWEKTVNNTGNIYNFKAWLYKLTYHLCIDMQRKNNRMNGKLLYLHEGLETKMPSPIQQDAKIYLEKDEEMKIIEFAIQKLPPRIYHTFILHYYSGMAYQEIAEEENISYANVRKRISEARSMLKGELRSYFLD
jgi:RNA polymerase sigma factor (sigma-70 family)